MPLKEASVFMIGAIGSVSIAAWAWRHGHKYGTREAEKDGQLLFNRGVAYGSLETVSRMKRDKSE
ncbi:hypothetical protein ACLQ2R_03400 [Streptosporangium sp. DT93]|uniref:hypothetical protein n=1 Tax=Streptosporangium sp. DT93 TaxID=3393428 RepID=UPI003CF4410B